MSLQEALLLRGKAPVNRQTRMPGSHEAWGSRASAGWPGLKVAMHWLQVERNLASGVKDVFKPHSLLEEQVPLTSAEHLPAGHSQSRASSPPV